MCFRDAARPRGGQGVKVVRYVLLYQPHSLNLFQVWNSNRVEVYIQASITIDNLGGDLPYI